MAAAWCCGCLRSWCYRGGRCGGCDRLCRGHLGRRRPGFCGARGRRCARPGRCRRRWRGRRRRDAFRRWQRLPFESRQRLPRLTRHLLCRLSRAARWRRYPLRILILQSDGLLRNGRRQRRSDRRNRRGRDRRPRCSGLRWGSRLRGGLNGRGLAALVRDSDRVGHIVDDDRTMNVVIDYVVRRRSHVLRRPHPNRNRPIYRHRQHENSHWLRWRCQHNEFGRRWCEEDDRCGGWWREAKYRIVEQ
jgi:hypothetical protein